MSASKPFLSIPEAAEQLGISEAHAYNRVNAGQIPTVQLGKRRVVPTKWLDELADACIATWRDSTGMTGSPA